MLNRLLVALIILCSHCFSSETADLLSFGAGINNVLRPNSQSAEFRVEYKSHLLWWKFRPMLGVMGTTKKAIYGYGGVGLDLYIKKRLVISPNFAAGYYHMGKGKNLGFPLEFRSGLELAYRFKNLSRIGVHFYHVSNASIGRKNPGTESLVFFISFPISKSYKSGKKRT